MNLYNWKYSQVLKRYSSGAIMALASSEDEARDKVREAFTTWLAQEREDLFMSSQDDDDREEIAKLVATLEADLTMTPELCQVVFVRGSE